MGWYTKSWNLNSSLLQLPIYIGSQDIGKTEFSSQAEQPALQPTAYSVRCASASGSG